MTTTVAPPQAPATRRPPRRRHRGGGAVPYLFIFPPLAFLTVFMFGPLVQQVWISFTNTRLLNPTGGRFVGLENYVRLFTGDALIHSLWVTVSYTAGTVVFGVGIGLVAALAITRPFRGRAVVRGVLLFGWAVPNVAASLIWLWMFNENSGILNRVLSWFGVDAVPWLTSTTWAPVSILLVTVWQVAPFVMLVLLAALQSVPEEVREAARVDGADALSVYRVVTLPHIMPTLRLVSVLMAVWTIRRFEIIYLLTGGGPLDSTSTLVVSLRQTAFEDRDLGGAGAYGVVGLVLALVIAAVQLVLERRAQKGSDA
ncbi:carbohydrate ABC transporter permease [Kineococcus sp. TBRC 1896]|uniref:Carbohydrate ABC transporter permease n=1 Tax=Kineococcus mangrovi TaxID=1660183 RepID=A0ABV4HWM4_9ACTN